MRQSGRWRLRSEALTSEAWAWAACAFEPDRLWVDDASYRLDGEGLARLCEHLRAPASYLRSLDAQTRQIVLQHHLDRGDHRPGTATIITRDDRFVAFGRSDLHRLDGADVLEAIRTGVGQELIVHDLRFDEDEYRADLIATDAGEEVAPGDVLRYGIRVTHSSLGEYATQIETYILRLICTNGLTHRECVSRRAARTRRLGIDHPDAARLQVEQIRRLARSSWTSLAAKIRAIRALREERVDDVDGVLTRWLERARLSPRNLLPPLREAWREEGAEATSYGVMNALTRVATHNPGLSSRMRGVLSGLAGVLAFRHEHICPRCFSVLAGPRAATASDEAIRN